MHTKGNLSTGSGFLYSGESSDAVIQFKAGFINRHFVLRMTDLQKLSSETIFSVKSDIGFPLQQAANSVVTISNLRFILGYQE